MARVAIVEFDKNGHKLQYVRLIAELLADEGHEPILITQPSVVASDEYGVQLSASEKSSGLSLCLIDKTDGNLLRRISLLKAIRRSCRRLDVHQVAIPHIDPFLIPLLITQIGISTYGLIMRRPTGDSMKSRLKMAVVSYLKHAGLKLVTLESPWGPQTAEDIVDPSGLIADSLTTNQSILGRMEAWKADGELPVAMVSGVINDRKHITEILEASRLGPRERHFRIAIIGKQAQGRTVDLIKEYASRSPHQLFVVDRYVSDNELRAAFEVADVNLLVYSNSIGSSGMLSWSVACGRPVVAHGNESIVGAVLTNPSFGNVAESATPSGINDAFWKSFGKRPLPSEIPSWKSTWKKWLLGGCVEGSTPTDG